MICKHAVVAAFYIYAQGGEDAAKRGGWRPALKIVKEITLLIMEKSWNCDFEFLWEPCYIWHSLLI